MPERRLVERYRLVTLLGSGGMGTVWRAYDELLGRDVAVKRIEPAEGVPADERATLYARAAREARAAAMLDHPGIITVHDVVEPDGRPWIIMELVEGRSLDRALDTDGPLPPRQVAEIGARLLEALTVAHGKGLLHRDVKPANVLLADDGRVVLTDFGIAALDGDPALTRAGALVGSPGFIAPERLRDEPAGPASDLWSLGATLYTAAEGRAPFDRAAPLAALAAVLAGEVPPPTRAGTLAPVLVRMLDNDPATRISAPETATALRRIAEGHDPGLAPPRPARLMTRPPWRRRAALVGGVIVAVVAALVTVPLARGHGTRPRAAGPRPVAAVDLCALLTGQQTRELLAGAVPHRDGPGNGDCTWSAPKVPARLAMYKADLVVAASFGAAGDRMAIERNELAGDVQSMHNDDHSRSWQYAGFPKVQVRPDATTAVTALPGVGDEAVTYTERGSTPYDIVIITLREGNVILELQWNGPRTGPAAAAVGARRAALAIAGTLAHLENRG